MAHMNPGANLGDPAGGLDRDELAQFEEQANAWWDHDGPNHGLHRLHPLRMAWIRDQAIAAYLALGLPASEPLLGIRALDIGCGGGLSSVALARMGALVTGIDPGSRALDAAREAAKKRDLSVNFFCGTLDEFDPSDNEPAFDLVLCLELLEHVPRPGELVQAAAHHLRPGGLLVLSTLNRTALSYLAGIFIAERVLRWVPHGTHDWRKFISPDELAHMALTAGVTEQSRTGVAPNISGTFHLSPNKMGVNYFWSGTKDKASTANRSSMP